MSTIPEIHLPVEEAFVSEVDRSQVAIIIPTCNAGSCWCALSEGLRIQEFPAKQVLVIDSSSEDGTRELAANEGYQVFLIDRKDFNHGGTRQLALSAVPWASIAIYLTQDAVLATPDSLDLLLAAFADQEVAAVYGRQLPRREAGPIEAHARLFNYPPESAVRDMESRHILGIKAAFLSNSFAAYRVDALLAVGGFPTHVIISEDAVVAGRLLLQGWKTAYVAEAKVYHSHGFTLVQEFQRYFDIGVCHRDNPWLRESFGSPDGEGTRFVKSELAYLLRRSPHLVPYALVRTVSKAIGYSLGFRGRFGPALSRKLSYHKAYWNDESKQVNNK